MLWSASDAALYTFDGDLGTILVQAAYFGRPDLPAVTISLGSPGHTSGYRLTGLHVGDYLLTGVVMCTGYDMTPHAHPQSPDRFPLPDVDDADTQAQATALLSDIAQHFHSSI